MIEAKYPRLQYRPAHQTRAWNGRIFMRGQWQTPRG